MHLQFSWLDDSTFERYCVGRVAYVIKMTLQLILLETASKIERDLYKFLKYILKIYGLVFK